MRLVLLKGSSEAMCEVCVLWPRAWPRVTKFVYFIPCTKGNIACAYLACVCLSVRSRSVKRTIAILQAICAGGVSCCLVHETRQPSRSFVRFRLGDPCFFAVEGFGQYYSNVFLN